MNKVLLTIAILLSISLCSCRDGEGIDTSDVDVNYSSYDFYLDFRKFDTSDCGASLSALEKSYPRFLNFYLDTLLDIGSLRNDPELCSHISMVINHKDLKFLADTIEIVYPNTERAQKSITELYKNIKYYHHQWTAPDVYFFDGGLKLWQVVSYENYIAIGLDMFLGDDFPYYAARQVPMYMMPNFRSDQIPIQTAKVIYNDLYPFSNATASDFLQLMIENGKRLLFLQYVQPDRSMDEFLAISPDKMKWLEENEAGVYNFFVQRDMLYNTSMKDNMKYISPAPRSAGMPEQAPAQTGSYIGYRVLCKYMSENDKGLVETLSEKDYNRIFQQSHYKPR